MVGFSGAIRDAIVPRFDQMRNGRRETEVIGRNMQKAGGVASLTAAGTVIVGLGLWATLLSDYTSGDPTPSDSVAFLADNEAIMYVWNLITLVGFSFALIVVVLALRERLRGASHTLTQSATVFGLIWAGLLIASGMVLNVGAGVIVELNTTDPIQAQSLWLAVDTVGNGLGGGMELVGSVWVLLVSWAAMKAKALPKGLNYVGVIIAVSGLVTIVPALEAVGAVFGLGLIIWLGWLGFVLLSSRTMVDLTEPMIPARDFAPSEG